MKMDAAWADSGDTLKLGSNSLGITARPKQSYHCKYINRLPNDITIGRECTVLALNSQ